MNNLSVQANYSLMQYKNDISFVSSEDFNNLDILAEAALREDETENGYGNNIQLTEQRTQKTPAREIPISELPEIYQKQKPIIITFPPKNGPSHSFLTAPADTMRQKLNTLYKEITEIFNQKKRFELRGILDPTLSDNQAKRLLSERLDCENLLDGKVKEFILLRAKWRAASAATNQQIPEIIQ